MTGLKALPRLSPGDKWGTTQGTFFEIPFLFAHYKRRPGPAATRPAAILSPAIAFCSLPLQASKNIPWLLKGWCRRQKYSRTYKKDDTGIEKNIPWLVNRWYEHRKNTPWLMKRWYRQRYHTGCIFHRKDNGQRAWHDAVPSSRTVGSLHVPPFSYAIGSLYIMPSCLPFIVCTKRPWQTWLHGAHAADGILMPCCDACPL